MCDFTVRSDVEPARNLLVGQTVAQHREYSQLLRRQLSDGVRDGGFLRIDGFAGYSSQTAF